MSDFKAAVFHPATLILWAGMSALLILTGPFATYEAPLAQRIAAWPMLVAVGLVGGILLRQVLRHRLPDLSYWQRATLCTGMLSVALALPAYKVTVGLATLEHVPGPGIGMVQAAGAVFVFGMAMNALRRALAPDSEPGEEPLPPLLNRIARERRGTVIRLSSSDHYVRVVTDRGQEDVLIRFADAIAELGRTDGVRVHRSHWVAVDAVTGHRRENGRLFLLTRDGAEIPVSRSYRSEIEARGLVPPASAPDRPEGR